MFKVFVRSKLEYCSQVWNPITVAEIDKVERVQRNFTRRVLKNSTMTYHQRLAELKLESLELRRLHLDMSLVFKLLKNRLKVDWRQFFKLKSTVVRVNRGHPLQIYKNRQINKINSQFFANRIVDIWNSLPVEVINSPSIASFKNKLAKVDLSRFLKGSTR